MVKKVSEKLVNNKLVDHLEKCDLFYDFQNSFRSSRSTEDILTVVSDIIPKAFNRSGATEAVALDIFRAFNRVWYAGLLEFWNFELLGQIFDLILSFHSKRWL